MLCLANISCVSLILCCVSQMLPTYVSKISCWVSRIGCVFADMGHGRPKMTDTSLTHILITKTSFEN